MSSLPWTVQFLEGRHSNSDSPRTILGYSVSVPALGRVSQDVIVTLTVLELSWDVTMSVLGLSWNIIPQPQCTPWQSIPGRHSNYDNSRTSLECSVSGSDTPWQSIPGRHSNLDSPGTILIRHSNSDSPGTLLGCNYVSPRTILKYNPSTLVYSLAEYPRTSYSPGMSW